MISAGTTTTTTTANSQANARPDAVPNFDPMFDNAISPNLGAVASSSSVNQLQQDAFSDTYDCASIQTQSQNITDSRPTAAEAALNMPSAISLDNACSNLDNDLDANTTP